MNHTGIFSEASQSGSRLRAAVLACVLMLSFRTFQYFPGMMYVQECWFVLCFLALAVLYPTLKIATGLRFKSFEIYLLLLMTVSVFLPAWTAAQEFGQPLFYGILAQRSATVMAAVLLIFIAMRLKIVCLRDIETALLWLAWGTGGLYLFMVLFLNPASFASYGYAFVLSVEGKPTFLLHGEFIGFGLIYYAFLGLRTSISKYYWTSAVFLLLILATGDARAYLVSVVCVFFYSAYRWRPLKKFLLLAVKSACWLILVCGIGFVLDSQMIAKRLAGFSDAFTVAFTGSEVNNASADIRILEVVTAWPLINKHPLLGNGNLSNQWEGGSKEIINANFSASDIGLIGVVYEFGIVGLLLFAYQFRFAVRSDRELPDSMRTPLVDASFGVLLLYAIYSFSAPMFVFNPELSLFFIAITVASPVKAASSVQS